MLKYRRTSEADRQQIADWIAADPDHRDRGNPDFWLPDPTGEGDCFAMQDAEGTIFYVRAENVVRLHIQFAPPSEKRRLAPAIDEFTKLMAKGAKAKKYAQLIFESTVLPLTRFLTKRGFRPSRNEFVMDL